MRLGLTELVFVLDKSGSMGGLESDTIGGYNSMLQKQRVVTGDCNVTTVLFANNYELLHDRIDIRAVSTITEKEYQVGGSTALLDAIGLTIHKIANAQKHTAEDYRAENVLFIIITDGQENSSREYTVDRVKAMIEHKKNQCGWEFIFLGANIDAVETAGFYGIDPTKAQNYHADSEGVAVNFSVMNDAVTSFRLHGAVAENWSADIQKDYEERDSSR